MFMLINVEMPTILCFLNNFSFRSSFNFMLNRVKHEKMKSFITSGPVLISLSLFMRVNNTGK